MHALAMRPSASTVSSVENLNAPAVEATYLNDSPRRLTLVLALVLAAARTSAKWPLSDALRPKAVTNYERWYIPVLEAIFACCVLTRHKDKTAPAQPQQPREPSRNSKTGEQTTHSNQPPEPRQEPEPPQPPLHDKADTLIDIGLACIGHVTARDNPYITPEQTQSRHNVKRPFLSMLSERYTDKDTRKALARHFMLYKEVTLFMIFASVLRNDKPLHTKVQRKLKIRLSLGLPSKVIVKCNDYRRKLSEKFYESYTRTKDLAGTLDYVFWSVLPEKLKGESFADLVGNGCLMQIFDYTRKAVHWNMTR